MSYSIHRHLGYTLWANQRLADNLKVLEEKILYEEVKSSFPSIAKTLIHMANAEKIWLKRLQGVSPRDWPEDSPSWGKELLNVFLQASREFHAFCTSQGAGFFMQTIRYTNLKGDSFESTAEEIMFHVVNHGTYHRGQVTTMLREFGVTGLPATDLIVYLRELQAG